MGGGLRAPGGDISLRLARSSTQGLICSGDQDCVSTSSILSMTSAYFCSAYRAYTSAYWAAKTETGVTKARSGWAKYWA